MKILKLFIVLSLFFIVACNSVNDNLDLSGIDINIRINRFDKDIYSLKKEKYIVVDSLLKEHTEFFKMYSSKVIGLGNPMELNYPFYLEKFLKDSTMTQVFERCLSVFPNLKDQENELSEAFKHLKYYFPNKEIPSIYAQMSGFNQSVVVADKMIGVSLDKYLGSDCEFYQLLAIPKYLRYKMEPSRIAEDVILAYVYTEFETRAKTNNVLSAMLYEGKMRYLLKKFMPQLRDSDLMAYSEDQVKWCENNEAQVWGFLIEQKHLFSTQYKLITRYTKDAPFTQGMPQESPGRAAVWVGYRIVCSYMSNNPDVSISDLVSETDYGKILRKSKYKAE